MGLVVIVQTVGAQQSDDNHVLHLPLGDIRKIHTGRIALILHVEAEPVFLDRRGQVINVAHHQFPVRHCWCLTGVLQRLHVECVLGVARHVGGELSHLIHLTVVGIFVGHGQHLVGLESSLQRDVAHRPVNGVFRRIQHAGALQFLVAGATFQSIVAVEHRGGLVNVSGIGIGGVQQRIELTGIVGCGNVGPRAVAQVVQRHDMSGVGGVSRLVGHPYFHAVDGDARHHVGQPLHGSIIFLAEEVGEEEVAVLLVV